MEMPDQWQIFKNPRLHIFLHMQLMINIKQQPYMGITDFADDLKAFLRISQIVTRMILHVVERFNQQCNIGFAQERKHLTQTFNNRFVLILARRTGVGSYLCDECRAMQPLGLSSARASDSR